MILAQCPLLFNACWVTQIAVCHGLRVLSNVQKLTGHAIAGSRVECFAIGTLLVFAFTLAGPLIQKCWARDSWAYTPTSSRVEYLWAWTPECTLLIATLAGCRVQYLIGPAKCSWAYCYTFNALALVGVPHAFNAELRSTVPRQGQGS